MLAGWSRAILNVLGGVSIVFAVVVVVLATLYTCADIPLRVALIGMAIGMAGLGFQFLTMARIR